MTDHTSTSPHDHWRDLAAELGLPVDKLMEYAYNSGVMQAFRTRLFTRVVPILKDIGLWGEKVQKAYADMGVLDHAKGDLVQLMKQDEEIAEEVDRAKHEEELKARQAEVHQAISEGAEA